MIIGATRAFASQLLCQLGGYGSVAMKTFDLTKNVVRSSSVSGVNGERAEMQAELTAALKGCGFKNNDAALCSSHCVSQNHCGACLNQNY